MSSADDDALIREAVEKCLPRAEREFGRRFGDE